MEHVLNDPLPRFAGEGYGGGDEWQHRLEAKTPSP